MVKPHLVSANHQIPIRYTDADDTGVGTIDVTERQRNNNAYVCRPPVINVLLEMPGKYRTRFNSSI